MGKHASPDEIVVRNPGTGELVARVAAVAPEAVVERVERARAAQREWAAAGVDARVRVLRRARRWMVDHLDEVVETIRSETGKTVEDAMVVEAAYTADAFGFWARRAPGWLADERIRTRHPFVLGRRLTVRHAPLGVVGVIGPWNYPLVNSFGDAIPALAAGNAVVLKPSEVTPLTSRLMERAMRECGLPESVFQALPGSADTAKAVIDCVDMVMFTGSTETGRKVARRAARRLTPVSLELGGKDPMLVLADADLDAAADAAVYYAMANGGQACISIERAYVEASVHDAFVARVTERVRALRHGPAAGPGSVEVGAITHPPQLDVIAGQVEAARAEGAEVVVGGRAAGGDGRGTFYAPTVLTGVTHEMDVMREETFGPVLPIMRVADADEAVAYANDSRYGLAASVWTRDLADGERIARRLEVGAVSVNDAQLHYLALDLPMGGWKGSGLGQRHGLGGIRKYTRTQSVLVTRTAPARTFHMFPYRARRTALLRRVIRVLHGRGRPG